ncbi:MAG TPA: amino acid permease, partial [Gammaproteobacteria bacterium]|nr:amino acid permease [Gammaproteobacteria bacterium]
MRNLGLTTLICLVVANMIGAGVFTTSGYAMADLGNPIHVLWAWLAGGILAVCGAMSYGALARLRPLSGGEYLYLSRNIHPLAG